MKIAQKIVGLLGLRALFPNNLTKVWLTPTHSFNIPSIYSSHNLIFRTFMFQNKVGEET